jgi:hypothetical protein
MNRREFFRGAAAVAASPALLSGGVAGFLLGQYGPPKAVEVTAWRMTVSMTDLIAMYHEGLMQQWAAMEMIYGRDEADIHAEADAKVRRLMGAGRG